MPFTTCIPNADLYIPIPIFKIIPDRQKSIVESNGRQGHFHAELARKLEFLAE